MIDLAHALPLVVLALAAAAYARGIARLWSRAGTGAGLGQGRVASFFAGLCVVAIAVASPLDALAATSFSMHMVQHVLLLLVAPPLLVVGAPLLPFLWALPAERRRRAGRAWRRAVRVRGAWRALTGPVVVGVLGAVVLWAWHLPGLYQAAILNEWLHGLEHATLLASSGLLWWVVLQPTGRRRVHGGAALLLVFVTKVHGTVLAALITFAPVPLYPLYAASAPSGRSAMEDQQLAGIVMGWPMAFVYLAAAAGLFLSWLRTIERRTERPRVAGPSSRGRGPRRARTTPRNRPPADANL